MGLIRSFVDSANEAHCPFPLNNLPCGVFSHQGGPLCCAMAIGDMVVNVSALEQEGLITLAGQPLLDVPFWNKLMAAGPKVWQSLRDRVTALLHEHSPHQNRLAPYVIPQKDVQLHLPFQVAEYTDFYASYHHATNVGTLFRGAENALPPNWLHMPIGYNGRASSVAVSGAQVRRPWGQIKGPDDSVPRFAPSTRFDFELELGAVVGTPSRHGRPVSTAQADTMIFGYVLLNDWSARDIQAWEYQPLGPFQAKATATSIGAWVVMAAALAPMRCAAPPRKQALLPYLQEPCPMLYDIDLEVTLTPQNGPETIISRTNYREMYYSAAQQLAHHTTSGCAMKCGDLLGSGTISGPTKGSYGSLLELSQGGKEPITLTNGQTRSFLQDSDSVTLRGRAQGNGYIIGFGECQGTLVAALDDPYE